VARRRPWHTTGVATKRVPADGSDEAAEQACFDRELTFSSFGRRFLIRTNDPALPLLRLLPPLSMVRPLSHPDRTIAFRRKGPCACGRRHPTADLFIGRKRTTGKFDHRPARERVRAAIKIDLAEFAPGRVFLHAGAVVWNGAGILIPGSTMSGKTTLVRAFLREGAIYYSDEYAVLDRHGFLHPYPQPLGLRASGGTAQRDRTAESLGAKIGAEKAPIHYVVATTYRGSARWKPSVLSQGRTLLALLERAVAAQREPERVLATLERTVRHATGWHGDRGDATETARAILRRIEAGTLL
jgi:hypothetical protein